MPRTVCSKWIQVFIRETVWHQVPLRIVGWCLGEDLKKRKNKADTTELTGGSADLQHNTAVKEPCRTGQDSAMVKDNV